MLAFAPLGLQSCLNERAHVCASGLFLRSQELLALKRPHIDIGARGEGEDSLLGPLGANLWASGADLGPTWVPQNDSQTIFFDRFLVRFRCDFGVIWGCQKKWGMRGGRDRRAQRDRSLVTCFAS